MAVYGMQRILMATSVSKSNEHTLCAVKSDDEGMTQKWGEGRTSLCFWLRE